jgi:hypothetical protein
VDKKCLVHQEKATARNLETTAPHVTYLIDQSTRYHTRFPISYINSLASRVSISYKTHNVDTVPLHGRSSTTTGIMASPATTLGFFFLTGNSVIAFRRSQGDAAATTFIIVSYACLVLLFYFLRRFETVAPGSADKDRAKNGVWLTTTLLTAMFSWRVAALMPWPVAAGVWLMAAATTLGGYYTLFLLPRAED